MRTLILALLILTVGAPAARADDQSSVAAEIARIRVAVVPTQVIVGACPGQDATWLSGCTYLTHNAPVYVEPPVLRWVLYHELGHRYSVERMSWLTRQQFGHIMRYRSMIRVGNERLADAYAACAFGWNAPRHRVASDDWPTGYGYWPTRDQVDRVCALFRS
jgi:hypothetical protein